MQFFLKGQKFQVHSPGCWQSAICSNEVTPQVSCVGENKLVCVECFGGAGEAGPEVEVKVDRKWK
jgi:hypothetical protein